MLASRLVTNNRCKKAHAANTHQCPLPFIWRRLHSSLECFVADGSGIDTPAEAAKFLTGLALDFLRRSC